MSAITRRDALRLIAGLGLSAYSATAASAKANKTVIIVGAGPAGMSAAWELRKAGCDIRVFEARGRAGGRMHTLRQPFDDDMYAEAGALFLGSNNPGLSYASELGLEATPIPFRPDLGSVAYIDGTRVLQSPKTPVEWPFELGEDDAGLSIFALQSKYHRQHVFGFDELATLSNPGFPQSRFQYLDKLSVADFWRENGASENAIRLMQLRYYHGYGEGVESASTLQFFREAASFLGGTGGFQIKGGNDLICSRMADQLGSVVTFNAPVVAIAQDQSGTTVTLAADGGQESVRADYVVVTAPIHVQSKIEFTPRLSKLRREANSEIMKTPVVRSFVQTRTRYWEQDRLNGSANTELPIDSIFHSTMAQESQRGILESFAYGKRATHMGGLADKDRRETVLRGLEAVYPGIREQEERFTHYDWGNDPWAQGGHAAYRPGQVTRFFKALREPEGRVYFAGDVMGGVPGYSHAAFASGQEVAATISAL